MSKQTDLINVTDAITVSGSNVGIGTSSPSNTLEVAGDGVLRIRPSTDNSQGVLYFNDTTTLGNSYRADIGIINDGGLSFKTTGTINTAPSERMRIDESGRVGIGTTSPMHELSIQGASTVQANLHNTDASSYSMVNLTQTGEAQKFLIGYGPTHGYQANELTLKNTVGDITAHTNGSERMRIDSSGRVTTPYQPYFLANNYGQVKAVGWHLLDFTTSVEHNVGNHYSTSGSKFTAPVAGVYSFSVGGYVPEDNNGQRYAYSFYVNGNGGLYISGGQQSSPDGPLSTHTQKIKLNANDYVQVYMYMPTVTTLGATYHRMWFNGCLIG